MRRLCAGFYVNRERQKSSREEASMKVLRVRNGKESKRICERNKGGNMDFQETLGTSFLCYSLKFRHISLVVK